MPYTHLIINRSKWVFNSINSLALSWNLWPIYLLSNLQLNFHFLLKKPFRFEIRVSELVANRPLTFHYLLKKLFRPETRVSETRQGAKYWPVFSRFRRFFAKLEAPNDRGRYLQELLNSFAVRFCQCNPNLGYSVGKNSKEKPWQQTVRPPVCLPVLSHFIDKG